MYHVAKHPFRYGYVMMHKGYVMMHKGYIMMHKGYVMMHKGYVMMHKGYVMMHKEYIMMDKKYIMMHKKYIMMHKGYIMMHKGYAIHLNEQAIHPEDINRITSHFNHHHHILTPNTLNHYIYADSKPLTILQKFMKKVYFLLLFLSTVVSNAQLKEKFEKDGS